MSCLTVVVLVADGVNMVFTPKIRRKQEEILEKQIGRDTMTLKKQNFVNMGLSGSSYVFISELSDSSYVVISELVCCT
jgi:hypothetical protein